MFKDGKLQFKDEVVLGSKSKKVWNILIVDDEEGIHDVTKLALSGFEFEKRNCNFIHAYSAKEAQDILETTPHIAIALIDVVMETDDAGLRLAEYIRNDLKNQIIRIILRTGQPGQAPEERVINDYDINDYKSKSELTTQKLYSSILTGLRTYRDMIALEKNRQGLKRVIESTASIIKMDSLEAFISAVLEQIIALLHLSEFEDNDDTASFVAVVNGDNCLHLAGSGDYEDVQKEHFCDLTNENVRTLVMNTIESKKEYCDDGHFILYRENRTSSEYNGFVLYMELDVELNEMDKDLIRLFFEQATTAYENSVLSHELDESQRETIFTISEIAEHRSAETGKHVKRVALYSQLLARAYGLSDNEIKTIYAASPMHDIGKIAIPDAILNKPGKLDAEEMEIMKTHSILGHNMLKDSRKEIVKASSIISKEHHEKWDGSGYPDGLSGEDIHISARIVALADVFDALGSKRVYKDIWDMDDILDYLKKERAKHFDPKLVDLFFENLDDILVIHNENRDESN
jgi:response regulator RpfG family c-di-GMP phosphodiesterase